MIQSGRASLVVLSTDTLPDEVSEVLGLVPTRTELTGQVVHRSGRIRHNHFWIVEVEDQSNTPGDQTGTRALRLLLERCVPAVGRVANLPPDCDVRIWWAADSDSTQGGFVLPVDVCGMLAELGVDVYATVYLHEPEDQL